MDEPQVTNSYENVAVQLEKKISALRDRLATARVYLTCEQIVDYYDRMLVEVEGMINRMEKSDLPIEDTLRAITEAMRILNRPLCFVDTKASCPTAAIKAAQNFQPYLGPEKTGTEEPSNA